MASFEKRGNGVRAIVSFPDGRRGIGVHPI